MKPFGLVAVEPAGGVVLCTVETRAGVFFRWQCFGRRGTLLPDSLPETSRVDRCARKEKSTYVDLVELSSPLGSMR